MPTRHNMIDRGGISRPAAGLPLACGIGLKPQHVNELVQQPADIGFVEIHAENYLVAGGPFHQHLTRIREHYALSVHGVSMSIGGAHAPDREHLKSVSQLMARYGAAQFSEHLAWSGHHPSYLNDLLPFPYTPASLQRVCEHIDQAQEALGQAILVENPATYVSFVQTEYSETDFIGEVLNRTGCGLLLDVNNAWISAQNHGRDAVAYVKQLPMNRVGEIHLAGHNTEQDSLGAPLLIDSHDRRVSEEVWALYRLVIELAGPKPTLIEWDQNVPELAVLLDEAHLASQCWPATVCPRGVTS